MLNGFMHDFVKEGKLGVVVGETLFLHGGLITQGPNNAAADENAFGHVPGGDGTAREAKAAPTWYIPGKCAHPTEGMAWCSDCAFKPAARAVTRGSATE